MESHQLESGLSLLHPLLDTSSLASSLQHHLSVQYLECSATYAADSIGQILSLCIVYKIINTTYLNKQWFQGILLFLFFGTNSILWLTIIGLIYMNWFLKELYITTAADMVRFNDVGYKP